MPRYVALLRSVNVAGHGRIAMADLVRSFDTLGHKDVATYIQTGNVLFTASSRSATALAAQIEDRLATDFGSAPAVILRTVPELLRVGRSSPYAAHGADPARHHVTFLAEVPTKQRLAALTVPKSGRDELVIDGREVYVHTPDGYATTRLTGTFLERHLGVVSTTRNWNTVRKLYASAPDDAMTDLVAVDWSGAQTGSTRHIWVAHVHGGELVELANGRTRDQVVRHLIDLKARCPGGLIVGLDFSFSLPAWFVRQLGHGSAVALWQQVRVEGEQWLATCAPPFWGQPGTRRPVGTHEHFRRTEKRAVVESISAKSTFQLRGPGSVGTGSIRGMPHLLALRDAGFTIWPFDPISPSMIVEVYPRLCSGPVTKSDATARARYIEGSEWRLTARQTEQVIGSEDAFDAAITALCMHHHVDDFRTLRQPTDSDQLLEGMIWGPHNIPTCPT